MRLRDQSPLACLNAPRLRAQVDVLRIGEQKFEVASVKPNKSGGRTDAHRAAARRTHYRREHVTAQSRAICVSSAGFSTRWAVPDWLEKEHFDILAKAEHDIVPAPPGTTGPGQLMLRLLLADRFKLAIHQEKRELPIYALVLARSDGRLGPQLQHSTDRLSGNPLGRARTWRSAAIVLIR